MSTEMTHAAYVDQVDRLRAALEIVAELDVAGLRAHHNKLQTLGPADPAAWRKHSQRIWEEEHLIRLAEYVDRVFTVLTPVGRAILAEAEPAVQALAPPG